jgi:outer membrane protein assembly factor BamB
VAADGRAVVVNINGKAIGLHDRAIVSRISLSGRTIARAAASRNHVFVSTTDGVYTLDADAATPVAAFPLAGGGIWSPAIGPQGRVYAMAANVLQIFPPTNPHRPPGVVTTQEHTGLKRP